MASYDGSDAGRAVEAGLRAVARSITFLGYSLVRAAVVFVKQPSVVEIQSWIEEGGKDEQTQR